MQTILVVEDEQDIQELIVIILGYTGYQVVTADNGQEALTYLATNRPDLILSDVMMPVMDGRELFERLSVHPEHNSIPVVLMSSVHSVLRSIRMDGRRPAAVISKPFEAEELMGTVSRVLGEGSAGS